MSKKDITTTIITIIATFVVIGALLILWGTNKKEQNIYDENTLYSIKFDNTIIRVEHFDNVVGQNQTIIVQKSKDKGKTFETMTKEPLMVSMEPKIVFLNEYIGFIIAKPELNAWKKFEGIKVTQDGGKTFTNAQINYYSAFYDTFGAKKLPYEENGILKLLLNVYQVKSDNSGYEEIEIMFESTDNGLTWNTKQENRADENDISFILNMEKSTLDKKVFTLKNNTSGPIEHTYNYKLLQKNEGEWIKIDPIEFKYGNDESFTLNPYEETDYYVDLMEYNQLEPSDYAVEITIGKQDYPTEEGYKTITLHGEFSIN